MRILEIKSKILRAQKLNIEIIVSKRLGQVDTLRKHFQSADLQVLKIDPNLPAKHIQLKRILKQDLLHHAKLQRVEEKIDELRALRKTSIDKMRESTFDEEVNESKAGAAAHDSLFQQTNGLRALNCDSEPTQRHARSSDLTNIPSTLVFTGSDGSRLVQIESVKTGSSSHLSFLLRDFPQDQKKKYREEVLGPIKARHSSVVLVDDDIS